MHANRAFGHGAVTTSSRRNDAASNLVIWDLYTRFFLPRLGAARCVVSCRIETLRVGLCRFRTRRIREKKWLTRFRSARMGLATLFQFFSCGTYIPDFSVGLPR